MKKLALFAVLLCSFVTVKAQLNVQVHYDLGHHLYKELDGSDPSDIDRTKLTTTVEYLNSDKWGGTFLFVDMDYTRKGVTLAYWEIARDLKFWNAPISAHLEYNGGVTKGATLSNCFLAGPNYQWNNANYSKGFSLAAMYKYIGHATFFDGPHHNFQITGTWYLNFAKNKCTFNGFVDFWKEKTLAGEYIFMSEPQFWVNLNAFDAISDDFNLSFGTEVEITNNFGGMNGFYAIPTVGMKWTF